MQSLVKTVTGWVETLLVGRCPDFRKVSASSSFVVKVQAAMANLLYHDLPVADADGNASLAGEKAAIYLWGKAKTTDDAKGEFVHAEVKKVQKFQFLLPKTEVKRIHTIYERSMASSAAGAAVVADVVAKSTKKGKEAVDTKALVRALWKKG